MKRILLIFLSCFCLITAKAQNVTIKGRLIDAKTSEGIAGASIKVVNGKTFVITGENGTYTMSVPSNGTQLEIRTLGYTTKIVSVSEIRNQEIQITQESKSLNEVVVTALGIERSKRSLGYATQEIKGEDLTTAKEVNVLNSLQGRVAGAQISQAATGAGGSSRVILRGVNSLTGTDNNALIVVDGVPLDNSNVRAPGRFGGIDYGSGISAINPDDIENINILKGPNAAALFGERASAGAIMITTKKGSSKGFGVSFNSNTTFENPLIYPDFQNEFGQGVGGVHPLDAGGQAFIPRNIESSWGPRMNGQLVRDWTGVVRPFAAQPNNISGFYETGQTYNNVIAFQSGNEQVQTRFSLGQLNNRGILPNSTLDRTSLSLRTNANITSKFSVEGKFNYVYQKSFNRPNLTDNPDNPVSSFNNMPRSINLNDLRTFEDPNGNPVTWAQTGVDVATGFLTSRRQNPFWSVNKNTNEDAVNRMIGLLALKYQLASWLSVQIRSGLDYSLQRIEERTATRTLFESSRDRAKYVITSHSVMESNSDFLFAAKKDINKNISFSSTFGGNIRYFKTEEIGAQTSGLNVANLFTIANGVAAVPLYGFRELQTNSLYGGAQFGYKNYLYLDLTGRNDWSSTLSKQNRSFFYPSANLSFVVTDALKIDSKAVSFAKLRASVAEVGGAANPYQTAFNYSLGLPHNNQGTASISSQLPFTDLKPQITRAIEFGTEVKFLENRIGLDLTYYKKNTKNQIFTPPISATSGFSSSLINAGNVQNSGVEILLNATPIATKSGLKWDISFNWAANRSKIVATTGGIDNFFIGNDRDVTVAASPDRPFGDFRGRRFKRNAAGQVLVGADGLPFRNEVDEVIGNYLPKWTGGMINNVRYKNFRFSFLIDTRQGGEIFSLTNVLASNNGNAKATLVGRDAWYAGTGGYLVNGVVDNGSGVFSQNTKSVNPQDYWAKVAAPGLAIAEPFIYDASFIKFRELTLGYTLPKKWLAKSFIKAASFSLVGRNLFLIQSNTPGFDPDVVSYGIGNVQSIENSAFPSTRSYGFNLNISL